MLNKPFQPTNNFLDWLSLQSKFYQDTHSPQKHSNK
uniref:Uncharacterized protein n=1 Tax=Anguilla anguilla TaxID=7936 RepID=A0A0E9UUH6_ANGAN